MEPLQMRNDKLGAKVVKALTARHFDACYCQTPEEALETAKSLIPQDHVVSWGGSASCAQIGLTDWVRANRRCIDRDTAATADERVELMRQSLLCDTFIMGTNALSEDGQLVNIDGNGNRVAAMIFGPKSVIVIAGINKVTKTVEDAYVRAKTIAAPINAQRFDDIKTGCAVTGACENCTTTDCICAYAVTTRVCRPARKIKVIVVGQTLGF